LHFNDADEVSCRAGATKCSRCRASFAPNPRRVCRRNLVSPLNRLLADPLSRTKNCTKFLAGKSASQVHRISLRF